ncbi:hypothetical protein [Thalassospira lohafexi]|uniref:Uncharacterized protein n=1 Tax=Thalassospira lohafexi TaxID=744227 RepID=A0A2N3L3X4_9PROT|nr:hypothetical protein [Thalassospira lohafexi]PKR57508.1 hypothetical protein COO92_16335 [Thalassospira lohafexi]
MSRDIDPALLAELQGADLSPILLMKIGTSDVPVRMWTGYGDLDYAAETYLGGGEFIGVSNVSETADVQANGVTFSMSGLTPELLSIALQYMRQGEVAESYLGALTDTGALVGGTAVRVFKGKTDVPVIDDDGASIVINLSAESDLIDLERSRVRRNTSEDQKSVYPDDLGFDFVLRLQETEIAWGQIK